MNRRTFLEISLGLPALAAMVPACQPGKKIKGSIVGASSQIGHLLRSENPGRVTEWSDQNVVIVGGGVSGLSAAWYLKMNGADFIVLDLEAETGGNARSGRNELSAFPWGAHYIPTPNNNLREYLEFLETAGVLTGYDSQGLPVYNDAYLCFDPQERLYINGRWQEGLIPQYGVPEEEQKEILRFLSHMESFRNQKGTDGKDAFAIPVDDSSKDDEWTRLDALTMKAWLKQNGYNSNYLHWYVNYCTRDDFGTCYDKVSAWVGIHYFAGRKGKGANASHGDVLTWPEGNHFLINKLQETFTAQLQTGALVTNVAIQGDQVAVAYYNVKEKRMMGIRCRQCILATPQFVTSRLLQDPDRKTLVDQHLSYAPWVVANLKLQKPEERSGYPLSWDNVIYESEALGYVEATHELLNQYQQKLNLTYYNPLTSKDAKDARREAAERSHEEWTKRIVDDLKKVHPDIEQVLEEVNIMVWGHAMAQPLLGLLCGSIRKRLQEPVSGRIHFAHTDLAGISIFEEGFYQGLRAGKEVSQQLQSGRERA
ncbi:MAG TPA: NAD(P)-binding protein [Flavisolibacter sp.]|nr:NAD(P)-binding protein [Flavisolibacter sp.]